MTEKKKSKRVSENVESQALVQSAFDVARVLGLTKLVVQADELRDIRCVDEVRETEQVIWLTRESDELSLPKPTRDKVIGMPDVPLTRLSQLKVGLLLAIMNEHVRLDESILCLSGVAGSNRLDMMLVANPERDFPWFQKYEVEQTHRASMTRVLMRIIDIALRLAREGREGRALGTILVLGDSDELAPYLRQLVLNPLSGHPQKNRNIHDEEFFETLREFAALDGAFVVNRRGVVESAGTYLDARASRATVRPGLGARHSAAAALTSVVDAIAVAISSSSGTVSVFHEGKAILELEKTGGVG